MWQLSECVDGLADACRALGLPVVGGNVSLYNESDGRDIDPTPVLGVLGIVDELVGVPPGATPSPGDTLLILGDREAPDEGRPHPLGGSAWASRRGRRGGRIPAVDLVAHQRACDLVVQLVEPALVGASSVVSAVRDVSRGGLAVVLAELCRAAGVGAAVAGVEGHRELFTELPSRFVVATRDPDAVGFAAHAAGVAVGVLGVVGGPTLTVEGLLSVTVDELVQASRRLEPTAEAAPSH